MQNALPSYRRIDHGNYVFELIFDDFKRGTIDTFKTDITVWKKEAHHYPRVRILLNLCEIMVPTPYASSAFVELSQADSGPEDSATAILVRETLLSTLMQTYIMQYAPQRSVRLFHNYKQAMDWLKSEHAFNLAAKTKASNFPFAKVV